LGETESVRHRRTLFAVALAALALIVVACAPNASQDTLKPAGPYAEIPHNLYIPVFFVATVIFVLVEGAVLLFSIRYRHRKGRDQIPPQIHGNTRLEIAWTILPAVILAGVAVPTVAGIFDLAKKPTPDVMRVNVLGHQWWWEFDYPAEKITTANDLVIPTGQPVYLSLCAVGGAYEGQPSPNSCQPGPPDGQPPASLGNSVIHSFWPPELAGTQDVVPGQTNHMYIQADHPGTYSGQCKEFCGLSHAYMRFRVVAMAPDDYATWVQEQQQPVASSAPQGAASAGLDTFRQICTACHAVNGLTDADGNEIPPSNNAPNLTHLMSRSCFAGCILEMNDENLRRWIEDPPAVKAGSWMPDYGLSEQQISDLIAYLNTLK
jgi:cytochrome c oxidase subunit 2